MIMQISRAKKFRPIRNSLRYDHLSCVSNYIFCIYCTETIGCLHIMVIHYLHLKLLPLLLPPYIHFLFEFVLSSIICGLWKSRLLGKPSNDVRQVLGSNWFLAHLESL